mgnify:CR=1 FL=1
MTTYKIAVLPGDGIGPEIMREAVKVLKLVDARNDAVGFELIEAPCQVLHLRVVGALQRQPCRRQTPIDAHQTHARCLAVPRQDRAGDCGQLAPGGGRGDGP